MTESSPMSWHVGFEIIGGEFVPWCECGWMERGVPTFELANARGRDHAMTHTTPNTRERPEEEGEFYIMGRKTPVPPVPRNPNTREASDG